MSLYGDTLLVQIEQKEALETKQASKEYKNIGDFTIAKITPIADFRDQWLVKRNETIPALKAKTKKRKSKVNK